MVDEDDVAELLQELEVGVGTEEVCLAEGLTDELVALGEVFGVLDEQTAADAVVGAGVVTVALGDGVDAY